MPVPTQEEWNGMRFLENLAASGSISFLQPQAVKDMMTENGKMVISKFRPSEWRTNQRLTVLEAAIKKLTTVPHQYKV